MDSNIDEPISESNKNYKLIDDIPNEFKFSSNRNISEKKSKMRKGKKLQEVHAAGLSCLSDTGSSHCVVIQHYVKKF